MNRLAMLALLLVACGEKAVTGADVWKAAMSEPDSCVEGEPESCSGFTAVPPGALRERLGAPEWTADGEELVTVAGENLRITMAPSVGDTWHLTVWLIGAEEASATQQAAPPPGPQPGPFGCSRGNC